MSARALTSALIAIATLFAGCSVRPTELARQPELTPLGSGLREPQVSVAIPMEPPARPIERPGFSSWSDSGADLFRDARAMRVGDVITVKISIKDRANIDNSSTRSRDASLSLGQSLNYSASTGLFSGKGDASLDASSKSGTSSAGKGGVTRSETIDLMVAAVVTGVLPNGHLVIKGTQEVRVNFEMRELTVAGIVRPRDVMTDNIVSYERIAEARISYGGRGRIMEVQQPAWGHQLIDMISPF